MHWHYAGRQCDLPICPVYATQGIRLRTFQKLLFDVVTSPIASFYFSFLHYGHLSLVKVRNTGRGRCTAHRQYVILSPDTEHVTGCLMPQGPSDVIHSDAKTAKDLPASESAGTAMRQSSRFLGISPRQTLKHLKIFPYIAIILLSCAEFVCGSMRLDMKQSLMVCNH